MRLIKLLLILLFIVPVAYADDFEARAAKQSSRDVKVPRALVARIELEYRGFLTAQQVSPKEGIKRKLLNITVELSEKRRAALHENVRINTPLGGGVIDLSEFVTPLRGAFEAKIKVNSETAGEESPAVRVFFVSHAKPRILGGEQYGAGCDKYMEVTSFFNRKMSHGGFELYTADQRYLSVLGGTFVLVAFDKEALLVGSVSFMDSRFPELMCE